MQDQVVLITGADGFLGRHLSRRLQSRCRVVGLGRNSEVDLADEQQVFAFFQRIRPAVVYHFSSASGGSTDLSAVLPHLRDDITTTVNCLVAAQRTGVRRFVIPGSTDEAVEARVPDSPYSMAKTVCVSYGRMFHALYGTPIVICRILMAYGPEQKSRKIVPYIIRSMLAGEAPKLASASRLLDWIYVDDAIDALVLAGSQPGIEGETFEIGSGKTLSIGDLAEQVRRMIPGAPQPSVIDHKPSGRGRCADLAQAAARLGWTPMVSLEEGLARTIEWYRSADRRSGTDIQETPKPMADQLAGDKSQ